MATMQRRDIETLRDEAEAMIKELKGGQRGILFRSTAEGIKRFEGKVEAYQEILGENPPNFEVTFTQWYVVKAKDEKEAIEKAQALLAQQVADNGPNDLVFEVEVKETDEEPTN